MPLTVVVRSGELDPPPAITFDAPRVVIGRGEGCEVRLPDPSVSHRHASIRQRGTDYILVDEGSTNGTFAGPVRLSPQAPRVVRTGDLIRVGRIWLEVRIEHVVPTRNPQHASRDLALGLVASARAAEGESVAVTIHVIGGPDTGRQLSADELDRAYVIGKNARADLVLTDADAAQKHVEIVRRGGGLYVRDLGSKTGTRLGDRALATGKETPWSANTELAIGSTRLRYDDPVAAALEELERAADELLAADETPDPPPGVAETAASDPREVAADASAADELAARPRPAPPASARSTARDAWSLTDFMVILLAMVVLALSGIGLYWLFGAE